MTVAAPPFVGEREADVLVLGAGLTGCAAALEFARRGQSVLALEAGRVGGGASASDLGHVPTGLGLPYTEAVKRLGHAGAHEVWEAHRENQARLREFLSGIGDDCGYHAAGGFLLAADRAEARALADSEDLLRDDGFAGEFLDHYMLEARFDVRGFAGAYWAADEAEVDPARLVEALAGAAEAAGAAIHTSSPVLDLELSARGAEAVTAQGRARASWVVVALDVQAPRLVPFLEGRVVPLDGLGLVLATAEACALPSPARAHGGRVAWRAQSGSGVLKVVGFGPRPAAGELEAFVGAALGTAPRRLDQWRGTAAASADGFPLVGPLPGLPASAACAYGALGQAYALLAARWVADALLTGHDPTPARFRAGRFESVVLPQ